MTLLITNATLLPCTPEMPVIENGFVQIEGETITATGAGPAPAIDGAETIDVAGDIVMPGMVNPHC
ncbi:MAG: amidohydrolase, partial [Nitratireductor sp.]